MNDYADLLCRLRAPSVTSRVRAADPAADAIEALLAECERLRAANAEQAAWIETAVANCAKRECSKRDEQLRDLRAELAAAQKDAERYRFLRDGFDELVFSYPNGTILGGSFCNGSATELDAAVDAAITQEKRDDRQRGV